MFFGSRMHWVYLAILVALREVAEQATFAGTDCRAQEESHAVDRGLRVGQTLQTIAFVPMEGLVASRAENAEIVETAGADAAEVEMVENGSRKQGCLVGTG